MPDKEDKIVLEREYIVPLRRKFVKVQKYRRANRAVKALKEFLVRHMKLYDRDLKKIKIDKYVNEEIWQRNIKKPLAKIKIKAKKFESGIIKVELAEIPEIVKFRMERERRAKETAEKKKEEKKAVAEEKPEEKTEEDKKEEEKDKKEEAEKGKSVAEAGIKQQEKAAKEIRHLKTEKSPQIHRMSMKK